MTLIATVCPTDKSDSLITDNFLRDNCIASKQALMLETAALKGERVRLKNKGAKKKTVDDVFNLLCLE
jgi:hypothetical protein